MKDENTVETDAEKWLSSSLIFARAISLVLKENEGIVVDLKNEVLNPTPEEIIKVVVFKKDDMVQIIDFDEDVVEGNIVTLKLDASTIIKKDDIFN